MISSSTVIYHYEHFVLFRQVPDMVVEEAAGEEVAEEDMVMVVMVVVVVEGWVVAAARWRLATRHKPCATWCACFLSLHINSHI